MEGASTAARSKAEVLAAIPRACVLAAANAANGGDLDAVILEHSSR
ncbi:MAG: hypothetical protein ACOH1Y_18335 [Propionicimonas sp.]